LNTSLTVIVPVRDSASYLAECLAALRRSTFTGFECIIVDDGSTDGSVNVARSFGFQVVSTRGPEGPSAARNRGAAAARTDLLFFLDADVCVHPDTIERIVRRFAADPTLDAVIGSYDETPADLGFVSQYKNLMGCYFHQRAKHDASTFWSACGGIRRSVLLESGGFDERFTRPCIEDIELGARLIAAGRRMALDPLIRVTHLKGWTLGRLFMTDIFDRALPWTRLILRENRLPNDLNLRFRERYSVALTWTAILSLAASFDRPLFLIPFAISLAATLALQSDFWRFLAARRGWGFAIAVMPLHLLYFTYSGLAFGAGLLMHLVGVRPPEAQAPARASLSDRAD
jgi:glycosyltransferase involved in cell wall biosynthesis